MADQLKTQLPHLILQHAAVKEQFSKPGTGGGGGGASPPRNRGKHAAKLIQQLETLQTDAEELAEQQTDFGVDVSGIYVEFTSDPELLLKLDSLESQRHGIELCTSQQTATGVHAAVVFIPDGKLDYFLQRVIAYRDEDGKVSSKTGEAKPKNQPLVDSIAEIKLAVLEALWTDSMDLLPASAEDTIWWEVWIRLSDQSDHVAAFIDHASHLGLRVNQKVLRFVDRAVVLAYGSKQQVSLSVSLLGVIAELRRAKEVTGFFTGLPNTEQAQWADEASRRVRVASDINTFACLLDTGVNNGHPLLRSLVDSADLHTYEPAWGTYDGYRTGHGTPMAGLALYGDLLSLLDIRHEVQIKHRVESVKILPNSNAEQNDPELYGAITRESISRVEIIPERKRVFCMAVSADGYRDRGKPSSWSASVDALSSGAEDEVKRLIILAAGDTDPANHQYYPDSNFTDTVQDPGQSWNALTVGGYTDKIHIHDPDYVDYEALAGEGDLSPYSCTSTAWDNKNWPFKPDIVMEAGNIGIDRSLDFTSAIDDLELLSTHHAPQEGLFVAFRETSAATALATRLAAQLQAEYPNFWPETLRALLVHSAEWTEALKARFDLSKQAGYRELLQFCGYGVPNPEKLFWSASNSLTLIAQDSLQPFDKQGSDIKTRDVNLHDIPWPKAVLEGLADTPVEMKVTLSYFIEPNPGHRGWSTKYRYASHRLQFDVKRPLETLEGFKQRINKLAQDDEFKAANNVSDSGKWVLGPNLRKTGSIHSDTWAGTAAELAERQYVAVYPLSGWWKELKQHARWHQDARYALVITIATPETDIYTSVLNQINTVVEV